MAVVACVLKSGGWRNRALKVEYTPRQVQWLKAQFDQHLRVPHRFVCLTDMDVPGVETRPLRDGWPGWWAKMELFREFESCFYVDLDTVIVGDVTAMVTHPHKFTVLANLSSPSSGKIGSGVMAWNKDLRPLYERFKANAGAFMRQYVTSDKWGDQGFIERHEKGMQRFQSLFPGAIESYKFGLKGRDPGPACRIVCYHGTPKPWETNHSWVPKL